MTALGILHLVGSPTSEFYQELSELYARACVKALQDDGRYRFVFAHVDPAGSWRFPVSLEPAAILASPRFSGGDAMARLAGMAIDVALPQMFCERGVSEFRALLDLLDIPYLGNRPFQMAIAADKSVAKAIVAAAGVAVPDALLLLRGARPAFSHPVVVKPNNADNSEGVTYVTDDGRLDAALALAFEYSDAVLVERYIPLGREVRCGVIERDGALIGLPLEEYRVDADARPVRSRDDKLKRDALGALRLGAKTQSESWIVGTTDPVVAAVHAAAFACYRAMRLRQYGLFDFRIDPAGQPWFLEASPYCSFAPDSVLVTMAQAAGFPLETFFADAVSALRINRLIKID